MRKISVLLALCCLSFLPVYVLHAQASAPAADAPPAATVAAPGAPTDDASSAKARAALDAMVQALGGDRWINLQNTFVQGRIAAFYQGKPTGATIQFWDWKSPQNERLDLDEKMHDRQKWVEIFTPKECWEITYKGKKPMQRGPMESDPCQEALRRYNHSIEMAVKVWMKDPNTVYLYEGRSMAERRPAEQVTLLNGSDDSITIMMDTETHLPLKRTYYWRDPEYKDKNQEDEEYDDYHNVDGLPTPFSFTRLHNGEVTQQRYVLKSSYNVQLPANGFDADAIAAKISH